MSETVADSTARIKAKCEQYWNEQNISDSEARDAEEGAGVSAAEKPKERTAEEWAVVSDALRPCPFCGGDAVYLHENNNTMLAFVRCQKCGAAGNRERQDDNAARRHWNTRTPSPDVLARLDGVIASLDEAYHDFAENSFCETIAAWRDDLKRIRALIKGKE